MSPIHIARSTARSSAPERLWLLTLLPSLWAGAVRAQAAGPVAPEDDPTRGPTPAQAPARESPTPQKPTNRWSPRPSARSSGCRRPPIRSGRRAASPVGRSGPATTCTGCRGRTIPKTGIGVSGYAWVDTGYEVIVRGNNSEPNYRVPGLAGTCSPAGHADLLHRRLVRPGADRVRRQQGSDPLPNRTSSTSMTSGCESENGKAGTFSWAASRPSRSITSAWGWTSTRSSDRARPTWCGRRPTSSSWGKLQHRLPAERNHQSCSPSLPDRLPPVRAAGTIRLRYRLGHRHPGRQAGAGPRSRMAQDQGCGRRAETIPGRQQLQGEPLGSRWRRRGSARASNQFSSSASTSPTVGSTTTPRRTAPTQTRRWATTTRPGASPIWTSARLPTCVSSKGSSSAGASITIRRPTSNPESSLTSRRSVRCSTSSASRSS